MANVFFLEKVLPIIYNENNKDTSNEWEVDTTTLNSSDETIGSSCSTATVLTSYVTIISFVSTILFFTVIKKKF